VLQKISLRKKVIKPPCMGLYAMVLFICLAAVCLFVCRLLRASHQGCPMSPLREKLTSM